MTNVLDYIKSSNQLVNTIVFPGSVLFSSYDSQSFLPRAGNITSAPFLVYIPVRPSLVLPSSSRSAVVIPAILRVAHQNKADFFIIHFHANACDIGDLTFCANTESEYLNAHYLIVEYPGYGTADGSPSESEVHRVARIVYDFVVTQLAVPKNRIVIFGRSIGTGAASKLAGDLCSTGEPPVAVVLQSPFCSLGYAAKDLLCGCVSTIMIERFSNWKHICYEISSPILLLHADKDQVIDHSHSEYLHATRTANGLPRYSLSCPYTVFPNT